MQPGPKRFRDMDEAEIANGMEELWGLVRQLDGRISAANMGSNIASAVPVVASCALYLLSGSELIALSLLALGALIKMYGLVKVTELELQQVNCNLALASCDISDTLSKIKAHVATATGGAASGEDDGTFDMSTLENALEALIRPIVREEIQTLKAELNSQEDRLVDADEPAALLGTPTLSWVESKESQELTIKVTSWGCQLGFGGNKEEPSNRHFSWDGMVSQPEKGFAGTKVLGNIELPSEYSRINIADYYKEKDTSAIGGFLFLVRSVGLGIDLYVNEETYHNLHSIFSSATPCGERAAIWIRITVKHARSSVPGFWQEGWQNEHLEISKWRVHAGAWFTP